MCFCVQKLLNEQPGLGPNDRRAWKRDFALLVTFVVILLIGALALTIYWTVTHRAGYAWLSNDNPDKLFNLHPTLMVAGFVTLSGTSMLFYRICRCWRHGVVKCLHVVFHVLAISCIVIGFLAALKFHKKKDIKNFYSLHSWLGLTAMGLFGMQYFVGFISFLCCCKETTSERGASLVPVHASFGIITFVVGVAACLTGLTEKSFIHIAYNITSKSSVPAEGYVINAIAVALIVTLATVIYFASREKYRAQGRNNFDMDKRDSFEMGLSSDIGIGTHEAPTNRVNRR